MTFRTIALLTLLAGSAAAERFPFSTGQIAEVVAELEMSSPGSDWAAAGREAAVATVVLDNKLEQHVMLFAGERQHTYRIFLGRLQPGDHEITVVRNTQFSARSSRVTVHKARFETYAAGDPYYEILAYAPVLFARRNTVGKFSDVPLLVYCERSPGQLQYTVVFSNEDGGTSTRALMARWGRTTDIEFVYRLKLEDGSAIVQGRGHKDLPFVGQKMGDHPLLIPVTDNNMVSGEATSPIRYQLAPVLVELTEHSREQVMDDNPWLYEVASKELIREAKLRPFGVSAGEKISDPRNYLYVEYRVTNQNSAASVRARKKGDRIARRSSLGRPDFAIERDGWVRSTVELPPGTKPDEVGEISLECGVAPPAEKGDPWAHSGACTIDRIGRVFLLDENYRPGPSLKMREGTLELRSGEAGVISEW